MTACRFTQTQAEFVGSCGAAAGALDRSIPSLAIAADPDVPDHASDEGASIENEGEGDEPGLVIIAAERQPSKTCKEFQYNINLACKTTTAYPKRYPTARERVKEARKTKND